MQKQNYMKIALTLAKKALKHGDIPIGAVVVDKSGKIIGSGYNQKEKSQNPMKHAEMIAINQACKVLKHWRLDECVIYTTLEPCLMCVGAILQARIDRVVFALPSTKFGCVASLENLNLSKKFNYAINYSFQLEIESKIMLQTFFTNLRRQNDII